MEQGDIASARRLQEEALQVQRMTLGPEHWTTTIFAWRLYWMLKGLGEEDAARTVLSRDLNWLLVRDPTTLGPILEGIRDEVVQEVEGLEGEGGRHRPIKPQSVLLVGNDPQIRALLADAVEKLGWSVETTDSKRLAFQLVAGGEINIVVVDLDGPGLDSLEVVKWARRKDHDLEVVVIASSGTTPKAAEAMRLGVPEYLIRPFGASEMRRVLIRLAEERPASEAASELENTLIGNSPGMQKVREAILTAAQSRLPVLILGETGTGRGLAARAIHMLGPWRDQPFVAVNCAAIPATILESELFGHVKGAFTGAHQSRTGRLAMAGSGTVLLDEIGELPVELQPKLLYALDEQKIRPLGSNKRVLFQARIVTSSNRNLQEAITKGTFRADLYFRLNVLTIEIPPLRQRKGDILALVVHFLQRSRLGHGDRGINMSSEFMSRLMQYDWPGNIRQLENVLERALLLSSGAQLDVMHLPSELAGRRPSRSTETTPEELQSMAIKRALEETRGDRLRAAKLLGISRTTLYRKLKEYGLQ
jgi:DNA-binding NtrC family response regulator